MTHWRKLAQAAICAAALSALHYTTPLFAADPKAPPAKSIADSTISLDAALEEARTYEYGKGDAAALKKIEDLLLQAARGTPESRPAAEKSVLKLLAPDAKVTRDAREFACRQLLLVGTEEAVPLLEKWLGDKELSHMARYALGRMAPTIPEAGAALRSALTRAGEAGHPDLRTGIANTLGDLRDAAAVRDLRELANAGEVSAAPAVTALGKIGNPEAVAALMELRSKQKDGADQDHLNHALLTAADMLRRDEKKEEAARLYAELEASKTREVKIAALRGLVLLRGVGAAGVLLATINGPDAKAARQAIAFTREVKDAGLSTTLVEALPKLPPELQEVLVRALGDRGDEASIAAIVEATKSDKAPVRIAALETLGVAGDASAVAVLAAAAAKPGDEQKAARESLLRLKGDAVSARVVESINNATDPKIKAELVRAMAGRRVTGATSRLFEIAKTDSEAGVRKEAILGLGILVKANDLKSLVDLAVAPKEPGDRGALEDALAAAFRRSGDAKKCTELVSTAIAGSTGEARAALVRLYKPAASPEALAAIRPMIKDPDKAVADAAVRTLADWPEVAAADDLLGIIKSTENKTHKVLALRGYIRLAGEKTAQKPIALYTAAAELAERPDEKRQILSGLGNLATADALTMAEKFLKDESVAAEAGQAVIGIVGKSKDKAVAATRAKEALSGVIATTKDAKVKKQAEDALAALEKPAGSGKPKS